MPPYRERNLMREFRFKKTKLGIGRTSQVWYFVYWQGSLVGSIRKGRHAWYPHGLTKTATGIEASIEPGRRGMSLGGHRTRALGAAALRDLYRSNGGDDQLLAAPSPDPMTKKGT